MSFISIVSSTATAETESFDVILTAPLIAPLIDGGVRVKKEEKLARHTVAVLSEFRPFMSEQSYISYCTGTLISEELVLTAAHCLANRGEFRLNGVIILTNTLTVESNQNFYDEFDKNNLHELSIENIRTHERYSYQDTYSDIQTVSDIALIKLERPAVSPAEPVSVYSGEYRLLNFKGNGLTSIGYGTDLMMRKTYPELLDRANHRKYKKMEKWGWLKNIDVYCPQEHGFLERGDSGGGTFIQTEGKSRLLALTSGSDQQIARLAWLAFFKDWIMKNAQALGANPQKIKWVNFL